MRFLLGLLGIDITLATVIPYQHVLHISKDSKLQSLHADESSNSNRPSPALPASTFVDPQDRGLRLDTSQQWSGYLSSNNETNLFFWMFESRKDPDNDPVILWLGGNPEGSSILNALTHWGPKHMVQDEFVDNPAAMNEAATVVFVDFLAGAGTGFSYTTDGTTTDRESFARSTSNVVQFLETLVKTSFGGRTFSGRDLHISGEYYAGLFIPSIANTIVSQPPADRLNLKSIMIGNGWLDALTQQKSIYQQRCDAELTSNLNRMLGDDECGYWRASLQDCEKAIVECRGDAASCARLEERCSESEARGSDSDKGRQQDRDSERSQVWKFLMDSKSYLGVDDQRIKDGEQRASSRKRLGTLGSLKANGDYTRDSIPDLGSLLSIAEPGFRVLLFAVSGSTILFSVFSSGIAISSLSNIHH